MTTADVLIVGGGVIGAASAYFASRAGFRTRLIEKRAALGTLTTAASLSSFRAQFGDAVNIEMMRESIGFFEKLAAQVDLGLVQQGYLFVTTAAEGYVQSRQRVELQRACGLRDVELWDGDEARRHFTYLGPNVTAATFRAKDGWLSAHELTYHYARASGAQIDLETTVEQILVEGGAVQGVLTNRGEIHAPRVVIAAGPFSKNLAAGLGLHLPIDLVRRQHAALKARALVPHQSLFLANAPMTVDVDTGAHWRPDGRGAILAWALPEEPGEALEDVRPDWDFAARAVDGVARVSPFWHEVSEHLRRSDIDLRAGQYDMTPDAKPLVSAVPGIRGLYLNCGYSGHGVMSSPAGGRVLADLLSEKLGELKNPFRLARFVERGAERAVEKMVL